MPRKPGFRIAGHPGHPGSACIHDSAAGQPAVGTDGCRGLPASALEKLRYMLAAMLLLAMSGHGMAIDIAWFEQRAAGSAEGEVRIAGLLAGELDVRTPGHDLEVGIMRYGDRAVVTLTRRGTAVPEPETDGQGAPQALTVTARQDARSARAVFAIAMPKPGPEEAPADGSAGASGTKTAHASQHGHAHPRGAGGEIAVPSGSAPEDACPVLTVRPGSLRSSVQRLLKECGSGMGQWVTRGGRLGVYTDWIVRDPEILAVDNRRGLEGLLEQLESRYGLKGVRHPRLPHTIDIYKISRGKEQ